MSTSVDELQRRVEALERALEEATKAPKLEEANKAPGNIKQMPEEVVYFDDK